MEVKYSRIVVVKIFLSFFLVFICVLLLWENEIKIKTICDSMENHCLLTKTELLNLSFLCILTQIVFFERKQGAIDEI